MRWYSGSTPRRGLLLFSFAAGIAAVTGWNWMLDYTSTDAFCESCHVHPQATQTWKLGAHADTRSGITAGCVQCHLPPGGFAYVREKMKSGARDVYGMLFKNTEQIDWVAKQQRSAAARHVFKASCLHCHENLFPRGMSKKGEDAHLHYSQHPETLRCINCHLDVGHLRPRAPEITEAPGATTIYTAAARVDSFVDFDETIPGTSISFRMVAIPGGSFRLGSPKDEPYRRDDEGPQQLVDVSPFWIGRAEVSWAEYSIFLHQTGVAGRSEDQVGRGPSALDAITGPTPPYGNPDQGWGRGARPAITMTHYAAQKYCEWLSRVTGKRYRLPTEAEWEYAARGGTQGPYFFAGDPRDLQRDRLWNRLFGADTSAIHRHAIYAGNSGLRTQPPASVLPNPFGLVNMLGNVREFCADWYAPDAYAAYAGAVPPQNPAGPSGGTERVVRGGSFNSNAADLRVAARDHTRHDAWMVTDPQRPKSLWWYSDCVDVGFRVVCEYGGDEGPGDSSAKVNAQNRR